MDEREYDRIHNEGGEGYNPIRAERERKELEAEIARPKSIGERRDSILRELNRKDSSIARESGTYDEALVKSLRAQLKALDDEENANFASTWTLDVTKERRVSWNARVKSGEITRKTAFTAEIRQGWTMADLKRAIKINNL